MTPWTMIHRLVGQRSRKRLGRLYDAIDIASHQLAFYVLMLLVLIVLLACIIAPALLLLVVASYLGLPEALASIVAIVGTIWLGLVAYAWLQGP